MQSSDLGSGVEYLRTAMSEYIKDIYENPSVSHDKEVDRTLEWVPSIHFNLNDHITVFVEVSDTPYPRIFRLRHAEILDLEIPVAVYCVCPEEAYLNDQVEVKKLISHGFGLFTVDGEGAVQRRAVCNPLVQRISLKEFKDEIKPLTAKLKRRLTEAFERYEHNSASGVTDLTEVVEGMVLKAGNEAVRKGWLNPAEAKPGSPALTIDNMSTHPQFQGTLAALGGVRAYINQYRNTSHHFPKNKKQAYKKYRDCRHGFRDGLRQILAFNTAMKVSGLSGSI